MISRTAEYALRAVLCLAREPDRAWTTQQIADSARIPAAYLSKILQSLARAGVVVAHRGRRGGFTLVHAADRLSVLAVVTAVDPLLRLHRCPLDLPAHDPELCPLHRRLEQAVAMVEQALSASTIAELLAEPVGGKPLFNTDPAPLPTSVGETADCREETHSAARMIVSARPTRPAAEPSHKCF